MSTATQARASAVTRASRGALPVVLTYAPFGLALGATLAAIRIPPLIAWSSSPLLFSGAAQLLAVQLLDAGASVGVVVLGALVVNARMLQLLAWAWERLAAHQIPAFVTFADRLPPNPAGKLIRAVLQSAATPAPPGRGG